MRSARRTVENPDIKHRAERQGLARHVREMEEQGFTVIERAISDDSRTRLTRRTASGSPVSNSGMLIAEAR